MILSDSITDNAYIRSSLSKIFVEVDILFLIDIVHTRMWKIGQNNYWL